MEKKYYPDESDLDIWYTITETGNICHVSVNGVTCATGCHAFRWSKGNPVYKGRSERILPRWIVLPRWMVRGQDHYDLEGRACEMCYTCRSILSQILGTMHCWIKLYETQFRCCQFIEYGKKSRKTGKRKTRRCKHSTGDPDYPWCSIHRKKNVERLENAGFCGDVARHICGFQGVSF